MSRLSARLPAVDSVLALDPVQALATHYGHRPVVVLLAGPLVGEAR